MNFWQRLDPTAPGSIAQAKAEEKQKMSSADLELKKVKAQEEAQTKRTLITEREQTRRQRYQQIGSAPHVALVLVVIGSLAIGAFVYEKHLNHKYPDPCKESSQPLKHGEVNCGGGARIEYTTQKIDGKDETLVRCSCAPGGSNGI